MATKSTRNSEKNGQLQSNKLESPHFYIIVFNPLDQGLKLPKAFMQRYGDSLKKVVTLKASAGTQWEVPVQQSNSGTWLSGKGLKEFGEFFSIQKEHFLLFQYKGNSRFHVVIFDNTASEIDYPKNKQRVANGSQRGTSSKAPHSHQDSKARSTKLNKQKVAFKSQYPSFVCTVTKSTISNPNIVHLPISFVRENFNKRNFRKKFKVRLPETGKTWPVLLDVAGTGGRFSKIFGLPGFRRFVRENKLELGEKCAFEMVKEERIFNFYKLG